MADYLPLISRAVDGLEQNTGENRRALYERARTALVNQLRSVEPPLDESEITRERLALEDAIRQVESEVVKSAAPPYQPPEPDTPEEAPEAPTLSDQALRDFHKTVAEVEGLGDATATAHRSLRETYDHMPGPDSPQEAPEPPSHYFEPPENEDAEPAPREPQAPHEEPRRRGRAGAEQPAASWPPPPAEHAEDELDETYARPPRDWSRAIKLAVVTLVLLAIAGVGYWQRGPITTMIAGLKSAPPATTPTQQAQPTGRPKIADRVGGEPSSSTANAPAAAVAQKVVLYDEDPNDPQGKRYVGSAIWRTETVSPGPGLAPELAVRADVEIPERRLRMTFSLRRNTDKALPASHTIEVLFSVPSDFAEGGISNVPGILVKQNEQARGTPLAGLAVKVTNGYFLIGLSAVEIDVQRNIQFLKERDWFDIPIVYTTNKRAILALEKGTPGSRAFEEAFRAWGQ